MIPFAEKTDSICPTCYRLLRGVERFKGSVEGDRGGGSQVQEGKTEDKFSKHLKEEKPILSMSRGGFKF